MNEGRASGTERLVTQRVRVRGIGRRPAVYGMLLGYAAFSTVLMLVHKVGVTSEHAILLGLVLVSLVAPARPFVWDWLPFLGVWVMFDDLGAMIGAHLMAPHAMDPIVLERTLLGGNVATVWLQQNLRLAVPWLDVPLAVEYLTFFAAPLLFALWLWLRHRPRFGMFVNGYIVMMVVGFVVFVLYPETPPWLAAQHGLLPPVDRVTVSLLNHLGGIGHLYAGASPAPDGAMPSLHVAVPMLIACTLIGVRGWRRRTSWLWFLYPVTMAFATLYLGEHYMLDTVAGMALGAASYAAAAAWVMRTQGRQAKAPLPRAA